MKRNIIDRRPVLKAFQARTSFPGVRAAMRYARSRINGAREP
jgi:hypothetical protein